MITIKKIYKNLAISNNQKKEKKMSKELKAKFDSFWIVCLTTFFGYLGKYRISMLFSKLRDKHDDNTIIDNNTNSTNFTNFYFYFSNETNDNNSYSLGAYDDKTLYLFICGIYVSFILISIILYSIFECCIISKKKNEIIDDSESINSINIEKKNSNTKKGICEKIFECCCIHKLYFEIFNCLLYIESNRIDNNIRSIRCRTACGETIKHYCNEVFCNILSNEENEIKCCCPCCKDYNEEDYDKQVQCFCYCYQEKGCCSWIDKFITNEIQKEIVPFMILYFISNLIIIGCENEYEHMIVNNEFNFEKKKGFFFSFFWFIYYFHYID